VGIFYFVVAITGISIGVALIAGPFLVMAQHLGWDFNDGISVMQPAVLAAPLIAPFTIALGVLILTLLMHAARGIGRAQVVLARALLVKPGM